MAPWLWVNGAWFLPKNRTGDIRPGMRGRNLTMHGDKIDVQGDCLDLLVEQALLLNGPGTASRLLRAAANLLEHSAYEIARAESAGQVARIILLAAELERIANSYDG